MNKCKKETQLLRRNMKNKLLLFISLILIAFLLITSYTPKAAQAETMIQEEPISETDGVPFSDNVVQPAADDSNLFPDLKSIAFTEGYLPKPDINYEINTNRLGFVSAIAKNFAPSFWIEYTADSQGCIATEFEDCFHKSWSIPVNVPHETKGQYIYFTYFVNEHPGWDTNPIMVRLYRRYYSSLETELVREFSLDEQSVGEHYKIFSIHNVTFDTSYWLYYLEFELPGGASRGFCGVQIAFYNPPLFPMALPTDNSEKQLVTDQE